MSVKSDVEFEKEIVAAGAITAPRLKPEDIDAWISKVTFLQDETLVICVITLKNKHKVIGTSRPVSDENFRLELGEKAAFEKARNEIWELAGFDLRTKLQQFEPQ